MVKIYKCEKCNRHFGKKDHLMTHIKRKFPCVNPENVFCYTVKDGVENAEEVPKNIKQKPNNTEISAVNTEISAVNAENAVNIEIIAEESPKNTEIKDVYMEQKEETNAEQKEETNAEQKEETNAEQKEEMPNIEPPKKEEEMPNVEPPKKEEEMPNVEPLKEALHAEREKPPMQKINEKINEKKRENKPEPLSEVLDEPIMILKPPIEEKQIRFRKPQKEPNSEPETFNELTEKILIKPKAQIEQITDEKQIKFKPQTTPEPLSIAETLNELNEKILIKPKAQIEQTIEEIKYKTNPTETFKFGEFNDAMRFMNRLKNKRYISEKRKPKKKLSKNALNNSDRRYTKKRTRI